MVSMLSGGEDVFQIFAMLKTTTEWYHIAECYTSFVVITMGYDDDVKKNVINKIKTKSARNPNR